MKTVLITGATGLVGSHLLPVLQDDYEVHVLVRRPVDNFRRHPNVHQHAADLSARLDTETLPQRLDAVIHLAQSARFREFPDQAPDVFDVNVSSLMQLLHHARVAGARTFVLASSGGVYGSSAVPVTEELPVASTGRLGFYLSTKLCGEILAEAYAPYMNVVMLRLFFAYGRGQKRSMLIPRLIDNVRERRPIVLSGPAGIRLNPVHAADAAAACKAALSLDRSCIVNVAGPETFSLRSICELIGSRVGSPPIFEVRDGSRDADLVADTTRMAGLFGAPERRLSDYIGELL